MTADIGTRRLTSGSPPAAFAVHEALSPVKRAAAVGEVSMAIAFAHRHPARDGLGAQR
jgi:hypothetical protein